MSDADTIREAKQWASEIRDSGVSSVHALDAAEMMEELGALVARLEAERDEALGVCEALISPIQKVLEERRRAERAEARVAALEAVREAAVRVISGVRRRQPAMAQTWDDLRAALAACEATE